MAKQFQVVAEVMAGHEPHQVEGVEVIGEVEDQVCEIPVPQTPIGKLRNGGSEGIQFHMLPIQDQRPQADGGPDEPEHLTSITHHERQGDETVQGSEPAEA